MALQGWLRGTMALRQVPRAQAPVRPPGSASSPGRCLGSVSDHLLSNWSRIDRVLIPGIRPAPGIRLIHLCRRRPVCAGSKIVFPVT